LKTQNKLVIIFLSLILSSCGLFKSSSSDQASNESTEESAEMAMEGSEAPSDEVLAQSEMSPEESTVGTDAPSNIEVTETGKEGDALNQIQNDFTGHDKKEPEIIVQTEKHSMPDMHSGESASYTVKKGETLMQIAFKIYGDVSMWKELKKHNGSKLSANNALKAGTVLTYMPPQMPFTWNPEGTPYMIKHGETLGIISNNVYQTPKKWKAIYENNKPLIKNPNLIYAGFTLYYKNLNQLADLGFETAKEVKPMAFKDSTEEIKVEKALSKLEKMGTQTEEVSDLKSATVRSPAQADKNAQIDSELEEVLAE